MPTSNYPHGFSNGVTMRDVPVIVAQNGNGSSYWVDSVTGSNTNRGTFLKPLASIDNAVGRCIADRGDMIFVAAGHTESVIAAAGLDLDIAGITVIFLGEGSNRGTIDFGTAVTADMDVGAANITMINPRFTASIDALTGPIDVNAANFKMIGGEYADDTSIDTTDCIVADANATGLQIHSWKYVPGDEGGTQKQSNIQLNGVDNAELTDINIVGDFGTGCIENVTDEVLNIFMSDVYLKSTNAGPIPGIVLDANATGYADRVNVRVASGTTFVSNVAKLNWTSTCLGYNADGEGGAPIGTADASGIEGKVDAIQADIGDPSSRTNFQNIEDMIGIPDAVNSSLDDMLRTGFDSSAVTSSADGSVMERQEYVQAGLPGSVHVVQKTLVSSAVVQAGVDITGVSSGGALLIEDVVMSTDATGLATGTNFTIESDNANGVAVFFGETVANLGASKTESLATGSVTAIAGVVLETGKKLIAKSTVADCTGAGEIDITIKFRRLAAGATIAAA